MRAVCGGELWESEGELSEGGRQAVGVNGGMWRGGRWGHARRIAVNMSPACWFRIHAIASSSVHRPPGC